eukprot:1499666-Prorocentrum_lima.AAC.1
MIQKANGRAERYIGMLKRKATSYLIHASVSLKFWYWAACQATYLYRRQVLEMTLPPDAPTFGNRVLIAKPPKE